MSRRGDVEDEASDGVCRTGPPPADREPAIAVCVGIASWKQRAVAAMLDGGADVRFTRSAAGAVRGAVAARGAIGVWPSRAPRALATLSGAAAVPLVRIEDGFIRSRGLGAERHPPLSIVLDRRGVHFDPRRPSDLETLLSTAVFPQTLVSRARHLMDRLVTLGVTKYNLDENITSLDIDRRRVVLVVGQVEDDLSVRLGGAGIVSNLELLRRTRAIEPDAFIVYKPHPDVEHGYRRGRVAPSAALRHADRVADRAHLPSLLRQVHAVHVLTSLTGFEALLRGREVIVHGQPFYCGWGLTRDLAPLARRRRSLAVAELAAAALILYPRYLDPISGAPCEPEAVLDWLQDPRPVRSRPKPLLGGLRGRASRWAVGARNVLRP